MGIRKSQEWRVRSYEFKFIAIPVPSPQSLIPNFQIPEKSYTIMSYAGVGAEASPFIDDN
ncbi:hypothetical protein CDG79_00765 [Nostoc sp. 'Peltigera membranacea cyanobiont' 232]|nr:hypothetical protein CDG79_00765 [Nostoc sp. 'Peltigera membranacea cyanobiont' 232]